MTVDVEITITGVKSADGLESVHKTTRVLTQMGPAKTVQINEATAFEPVTEDGGGNSWPVLELKYTCSNEGYDEKKLRMLHTTLVNTVSDSEDIAIETSATSNDPKFDDLHVTG